MDKLISLIFSLGSGLCHQLPERSFIWHNVQLPLCARCTGIYFGFLFAFILLAILYRKAPRRGGLSDFYYGAIVVMGLPLVVDGLTSYLGFRSTTNAIRLASGAAFGAVLAVPIYYIVCDALLKSGSREKVLGDVKGRIIFCLAIPITYLFVVVFGPRLPYVISLLLGMSIIVVFSLTAAALVGMIPVFERNVSSLKTALLPGAISLVCGLAILAGTWALQTWIHRLAGF